MVYNFTDTVTFSQFGGVCSVDSLKILNNYRPSHEQLERSEPVHFRLGSYHAQETVADKPRDAFV